MFSGLNLIFAFHHCVVFLGSYITLTSKYGLGVLICIGFSAEIGSGFYNMDGLYPNRIYFRILYQIIMTLSNGFCTYGMIHYYQLLGNPESYRIIYLICTCALVLLRTAGQILEVRKYFDKSAPGPVVKKTEDVVEEMDIENQIENPVGPSSRS